MFELRPRRRPAEPDYFRVGTLLQTEHGISAARRSTMINAGTEMTMTGANTISSELTQHIPPPPDLSESVAMPGRKSPTAPGLRRDDLIIVQRGALT